MPNQKNRKKKDGENPSKEHQRLRNVIIERKQQSRAPEGLAESAGEVQEVRGGRR